MSERQELRNFILENDIPNKEGLKQKLIKFFKDNTDPEDKEVHAYAEKLGIEPDELEDVVYSLIGDFVGAGRAKEKGIIEKDVDPKELAMGIKVEMEHTDNKYLAKKVSIDHLSEIKNYYSRLKKMEKEAGIKENTSYTPGEHRGISKNMMGNKMGDEEDEKEDEKEEACTTSSKEGEIPGNPLPKTMKKGNKEMGEMQRVREFVLNY